jgi:hypothetical protein
MLRCEADLWSLRNKCEIVFPVEDQAPLPRRKKCCHICFSKIISLSMSRADFSPPHIYDRIV